jgi:hypothetical protein
MKSLKLAVLAAAIMMAMGSLCARADSLHSDDLTLCCASFNNAPKMAAIAVGPGPANPQVLGCTAIDGSVKSINNCSGVVFGCSEGPYLCQPSTSYPGQMDCFCSARGGAVLGN